MRPLTDRRPKPMLPVAGRPLVDHTADTAVEAGATRLIMVVGYRAEDVRQHFGKDFRGVPVEYVEQPNQRGTADAVRAAATILADDSFAVLNGDMLCDAMSLTRLFENGPAVGCYPVDHPSQYGVLTTASDHTGDAPSVTTTTDGTRGDSPSGDATAETRITGVVEKPANPPSDLINTGAYVFPAEAQQWLDVEESERGEAELTDTLEQTADATEVRGVPFDQWLDVGRPWELLEANEQYIGLLDRRIDGTVHPDAEIRGPVVVESGAEVDAGVVIEGPTLVGENAQIGPNAYVRGATYVAPDTKVGHSVEIKNSVLMRGATVGHLSYVGDSVLGRKVNFGAGTTVANLRHDEEPVQTTVKGETTSTGRRKFGVVCGDTVKTGIHTTLNAGCVLDTGTTTVPGESVL